jgi:hypothetical protein
MTPPYKLLDQATGEEIFADMDTAPGQYIEVWSGPSPSSPIARISPGALLRPGDPPVEPPIEPPIDPPVEPPIDPIPPTPGDDGMDSVTNETELRDALQTYANEARVGSCGSKTPVIMTKPIVIKQQSCDGFPWGVNGNFLRVLWQGPAGQDMITYQGVNGVQNRGLFIEKLCMDGNGWGGSPGGSCLKIYAPDGDPGSIYKFTLRDIFTNYASHGVHLAGAVFEGLMENIHAENHTGDGIYMEHLGLDGMAPWSIVSNVMIVHPNASRNFGAGMRQVYSVNSILGSYVLNAAGGIVGPDGIRAVMLSNGENTGEQLFVLSSNGYGSITQANEGSTDGNTRCRKYEGGQWVDVGKPMLYGTNNVEQHDEANHMSYYGDGSQSPRWMK